MFKIYRYEDDETFADTPETEDVIDNEDEDFDGEDFDTESESKEEDPDFQGVIRTVTGACMVYKRKDEQNTFEELWVYNVGGRDIKPETKIRNSILAGTDIDPKTQRSEDGQQTCETITVGNVQFLHIKGLLN